MIDVSLSAVDQAVHDFHWDEVSDDQRCWCQRPAVIQRTTLDGAVCSAYCATHRDLWWRYQYSSPPPAWNDLVMGDGVRTSQTRVARARRILYAGSAH
ncbi:hypothetical protein [Sulfobacillus thermosulfidooxidans]|uniref:hypothetical protein n=1 Tax=Sulfobacillus thermosulfidooxidans TaxID=28034 RepID=UPI00036603B9|nr:hypothetical protein [Sulfobacillus thermosulfidooxidans]